MQQRTIDKLRKKLTKERKRRSKIQGELKLSPLSLGVAYVGGYKIAGGHDVVNIDPC